MSNFANWEKECTLCPRKCKVNRENSQLGYCRMPDKLYVARAALHMWEEPCISGKNGSGTIFFEGCNLRCVYCQNGDISGGIKDQERWITGERLSRIMLGLQKKGANNINLVTPTHYVPVIVEAITLARANGLVLPIVYNCGGYENVETLKELEGMIDIYLPDFKYMNADRAMLYSKASNYPEIAKKAIWEMVRQTGECVFDKETGIIKKGVIVRHLVLPDSNRDTKQILRYLHETYGDKIYISLMSQYTPISARLSEFPQLNQKVNRKQYDKCIEFAKKLGITNAYVQEDDVALESFIPAFEYEGVFET